MPRLPRISLEGAVNFVTSRGLQDKKIFTDKGDFSMYLELLAKYKSQHKFKLYAYSLHADRIQLLIEAGQDATISEIMHDLTSLYTKYYNSRHGKRGHLFESRFKSVLVEKAQYLLAMTRHIHLNDQDSPKDYPYSSFQFYLGGAAASDKLNLTEEVQEVKNFLMNKDNPEAYEVYCLKGDEAEIEDLAKRLKRGSVLGSECFHREVENKLKEFSQAQAEKNSSDAADKMSRWVYVVTGSAVLALSTASVYLYFAKIDAENKYRQTVQAKEAEFSERTRFENRSPITPTELEGSQWEIEILGLPSGRPTDQLKDKIRFENGSFSSQVFEAQGFRPTQYVLVPEGRGAASWQCAQSNGSGEVIRWQGQWKSGAMKGTMSHRPKVGGEQTFSFFSKAWGYVTPFQGAEAAA